MPTGGRASSRRGRLAPLLVAGALLGACSEGSEAELRDQIAELEQENAELRAQLTAATGSTVPGTAGEPQPNPPTSAPESTTATTAERTTTTTERPRPPLGSRRRPIPLGRRIPDGDWVLRVLTFEPNADAAVLALDPDNPPAGEGRVYARLRMRAVYRGDGAGNPRRLTVNLVTEDGRTIGETSVCCRDNRDALSDQAETFRGGSVEGWIYYIIPAVDAFGGKFLGFDPRGDFPGVPGGIGFFRVN